MPPRYRHEYTPSPRPVYLPEQAPYPCWAWPSMYSSPVVQAHPLPPKTPKVRSAERTYDDARANAKAAEDNLNAAKAEAAAQPTYSPYPYVPSCYGSQMASPAAANLILNSPQNCNVYPASAPGYGVYASPYMWTPVPSYVTLSPPAPPYMEPGSPSDIPTDRWENGKDGYLYDNRRSPVEVNSCHSVLEVHPILSNASDFPLIMDLCLRREDVTTIESPGIRWWSSDDGRLVRSQPAVLPRVTRLRLGSTKMREFIDVVNPRGVTVILGSSWC